MKKASVNWYQRVQTLMIGLCICCASTAATADSKETRINQLFNFGWKFQPGDPQGAEQPAFSDANWRNLDLPHDFQIEQPWDSLAGRNRGFKAMGTGWYRKTFNADPTWKGRRVLLDFEGIMLRGDVWVNGKKIGGTDYGYLGFEADIAHLLNFDGENIVAVRAETGETGNSRWYTGGGLFRDVHLVVRDSISIARHGVYVQSDAKTGKVRVTVDVEGIKEKSLPLDILVRILSPEGNEVASTQVRAPQKNHQPSVEVNLPEMTVSQPQLWDLATPYLYKAEVQLVMNGQQLDNLTERFGFRTIEFSKEFGLKLNGRKVFLQGLACHHDIGALGAAAFETGIARMMDRIKAFGFNNIRTSHNPYSESFLRLADEKGLLIVDELYDKWGNRAWAGRKPFTELWWQNVPEWIKRDRNHPSVIMWSLGNELQFEEERCGFPTRDWGVTCYNIMKTMVKRYDPSRLTTVAMYPARAGGIKKHDPDFTKPENILPPELSCATEIASYNYCWDDYAAYVKTNPNLIVYQSEAVTNELAAPYFGMDYDHMVGLSYWGAIEYWGESTGWPRKGWDYSFFNHSLEPKPQAYLIKSVFERDKPQVHISIKDNEGEQKKWNDMIVGQAIYSDHWNRTPGQEYNVNVYTNAEEVELFLNGKSLGVKKNPTDVKHRNNVYWGKVAYEPGVLKAIARTKGQQVAETMIETTGEPVRLVAEVENPCWKADGMDLQYVRVYAVDKKGRKVATANQQVTFSVEGAGRLIATDNGNHSTSDLFNNASKQLFQGFAMAIIRSDRTPSKVRLTAKADGLKSASVVLQSK